MQEVACAICGARDTRSVYAKLGCTIEQCRRCGLVYANPRAPQEWIFARYSREYFWGEYLPAIGAPEGKVDERYIDRRYGPMLAFIRQQALEGRRLLEVGTGAGLFLKAAERSGWEVAGLELSPEGAAFARDRLGLNVRQERAEEMSFPDRSFDVAVMFDVIEHLLDPRAVVEATRRALRPGGTLIVGTPNLSALTHAALGVDWAVLSPLEHLYYFTEGTLTALLRSCGFADIRIVRRYPGWTATESMNYLSTHAPGTWRHRVYGGFVRALGPVVHVPVQWIGKGDGLLAVATVDRGSDERPPHSAGTAQ
jgi:SAM-dependent methyltransferase